MKIVVLFACLLGLSTVIKSSDVSGFSVQIIADSPDSLKNALDRYREKKKYYETFFVQHSGENGEDLLERAVSCVVKEQAYYLAFCEYEKHLQNKGVSENAPIFLGIQFQRELAEKQLQRSSKIVSRLVSEK